MKKLVISIVLLNLLAACASEKPKEAAAPAPAPVAAAAPAAAPAAPAQTSVDPLNDPHSILAGRSTYYPFDVSAVQAADKPLVEAHAKYLSQHPEHTVRLEGNCDERGSAEYNLGLGQRRADGVMKMLEAGGAQASQLSAISYGKEKPRASGHNEAAWAQNRRTDIDYTK